MSLEWTVSVLAGASVSSFLRAFRTRRTQVVQVGGPTDRTRWLAEAVRRLDGLGRTRGARRLTRRAILQRRLELAGKSDSVDVASGTEVALAVGGAVVILPIAIAFPPAFVVVPLAALAAARGYEAVLARRGRRRQERIASSVPDLVELLVATTDAGLSPGVALARTAEVLRGPLGDEVRSTVSEVELGVPWQQAMDQMVARTEVPALRALAAALSRSGHLGTVLGSTLRRVAEDLRRERRARAEETARKAPIKMLFPLVFLILPAFLLLTVGPVVLATIRSLH